MIIRILIDSIKKKIDTNDFLLLAFNSFGLKSQIEFYPVDYDYNSNGLTITDKNGYYFSIDEEQFILDSVDDGETTWFIYEDKEHGNRFEIIF